MSSIHIFVSHSILSSSLFIYSSVKRGFILFIYFLLWRCDPPRVMASSFLRFSRSHATTHRSRGRTPLDKGSARRRGLYLTTHNTHNRQTSLPPVGFEPTISAGERPQTYVLDRATTGTGKRGFIHSCIPTKTVRC